MRKQGTLWSTPKMTKIQNDSSHAIWVPRSCTVSRPLVSTGSASSDSTILGKAEYEQLPLFLLFFQNQYNIATTYTAFTLYYTYCRDDVQYTRECILGYMQMLHCFVQGIWASVDFGTKGDPVTTKEQMCTFNESNKDWAISDADWEAVEDRAGNMSIFPAMPWSFRPSNVCADS
jgi:hypothetical protein